MEMITTASTIRTIIKILNIGYRLPCKINEKPCVLCRVYEEKIYKIFYGCAGGGVCCGAGNVGVVVQEPAVLL
jgi:hypothetical protein